MNNNQRGLVYLLSTTLNEKEIDNKEIQDINWEVIFEEAKNQQIYSLLYPIIKKIDLDKRPSKEIMSKWGNITIIASVIQSRNLANITSILNKFNEIGIEVLALKGLVLRELYSIKDFRTMSDYDLLMKVGDLERASKILLSLGYFEEHRDSKHIVFQHKLYLSIEVHWLLVDPNHFKNAEYLENNAWQNVEQVNIGGAVVKTLSLENQMLYLCLHLAVHFIFSGFGLKQLCDIVLLVKAKGNEINWSIFLEKSKECKIDKFVIAIFEICRKLFDMTVPELLYNKNLENDKNIDLILYSIFSGGVFDGVFGKVIMSDTSNEKLLHYSKDLPKSKRVFIKFKFLLGHIFPEKRILKLKYKYINKFPMLLPVAWIQRLIEGIVRKDFSIKEKGTILLSRSDISRNRAELFKWLEL